jgi:hypothetical protein
MVSRLWRYVTYFCRSQEGWSKKLYLARYLYKMEAVMLGPSVGHPASSEDAFSVIMFKCGLFM